MPSSQPVRTLISQSLAQPCAQNNPVPNQEEFKELYINGHWKKKKENTLEHQLLARHDIISLYPLFHLVLQNLWNRWHFPHSADDETKPKINEIISPKCHKSQVVDVWVKSISLWPKTLRPFQKAIKTNLILLLCSNWRWASLEVKQTDFWARMPGFKTPLCHLLDVWCCTCFLTFCD